MATLEELKARRDKLREARAGGISQYSFKSGNGVERAVTYKSDTEMAAAIRDLNSQIAAAGNGNSPNLIKVRGTKGAF